MKVKSVIKLFRGSTVNICNNHGTLLTSVYVDDFSGETYACSGFTYSTYELIEDCKIDKIASPNDEIYIELK